MRNLLRVSLLAVALARGASAEAWMDCAPVFDDAERLRCYDAASLAASEAGTGAPAAPSAPQSPAPPLTEEPAPFPKNRVLHGRPVGPWMVKEDVDPMTDQPAVYVTQVAEGGGGSLGRPKTLTIRCQRGELNLFVSWGEFLGDETQVSQRWDRNTPGTADWKKSADSMALFYPLALRPHLARMSQHSRVIYQVKPYRSGPVTVEFRLDRLAAAVAPALAACPRSP